MLELVTPSSTTVQQGQEISITENKALVDIRQKWKTLADKQEIKSEDIVALCLHRTLYADEGNTEAAIVRITKSFTPITNANKLANGATPYMTLQYALRTLKYSSVFSWVNEDEQNQLLALAKDVLQKFQF